MSLMLSGHPGLHQAVLWTKVSPQGGGQLLQQQRDGVRRQRGRGCEGALHSGGQRSARDHLARWRGRRRRVDDREVAAQHLYYLLRLAPQRLHARQNSVRAYARRQGSVAWGGQGGARGTGAAPQLRPARLPGGVIYIAGNKASGRFLWCAVCLACRACQHPVGCQTACAAASCGHDNIRALQSVSEGCTAV